MKSTLLRSGAPVALRDEARGIELALEALKQQIGGNERRDLYSDVGPISINGRIQPVLLGTFRSTYGPTPTHVQSLQIAEDLFVDVEARLDTILDEQLPALREQLDEQDVPWTPGRGVPDGD